MTLGCILLSASILILSLWSSPATAHRLRPAIATLEIGTDNRYELTLALNAEAVLAGIAPTHADTDDSPNAKLYDELRALPPEDLRDRFLAEQAGFAANISVEFDGVAGQPVIADISVPEVGDTATQRVSTLTMTGTVPAGAERLVWTYAEALGSSAVRISIAGREDVQTAFLAPGEASPPFALGRNGPARAAWQVSIDYIVLGFTHILPKGLDHILFVLGIFLLSQAWPALLYQVTAFTVAHSITLGLSLYGIVSLSPGIVEPLIALSIVYVGVENVLTGQLKPWRIFIVFGFGLLHGMGFAGVLTELGLPRNSFLNALISFNVGVELGQLAVIAIAFAAVAAWFRDKPWYRSRVTIPASLAIALTGAWWTVERTF